ncbi:PPE domain-containing protein [Saccharopolyspora taberi]|uniref:PPE domain-containing protein n=1 Tax=Saccharopolyspora taberi TaxID=60895 RepID=A0ABN3VAN0_9PSEU
MSDHRWQGYRHQELFDQIHQGPGADGSSDSIRRWSELTRALGEIDTGLAGALAAAMGGWQGSAADSARDGLRPLGNWAVEAQQAAEDMRDRAERQAEYISKARADMPPPVPVTAEEPGAAESMLTHLFGGQTDYEVQEAQADAAEQRAFEVMRTYESSTTANTTSLASFTPPPQVVVDAPVLAGASGGGAQQPITISWGPSVPAIPAARGATGLASRSGAQPAGRAPSGSGGGSTSGRGGAATPGLRRRRREPEQVDHQVTEEFGRPGGFFDEQRTLSRPVIGGEPGR